MSEVSNSDSSLKYHKAVARISEINAEIPVAEEKRRRLELLLDKASERLASQRESHAEINMDIRSLDSQIHGLESQIEDHDKEIARLEASEGGVCKYCFGKVSKENFKKYKDQMTEKINTMRNQVGKIILIKSEAFSKSQSIEEKMASTSNAVAEAKRSIAEVSDHIKSLRSELSSLGKIERPTDENVRSSIIEGQIKELTSSLAERKKSLEEDTPFKQIIESLLEDIESKSLELKSKKAELESLEKELPYYDFWQTGFGDSGIRKFVVDGIIPALNARISHWLQFLIDGRTTLEFDNELDERIQRNPPDGDPFVYHAMSGGERRRLNLAVSQAFAYVMMLNSGTCPSLVFLDEVTTNIDQMGVVGVYKMIVELAKDRQVFITTHDQNLLEMLDGCEHLTLEKRGGFTSLKN